MAQLAAGSAIRQLGSLFEYGSAAGLSDRQLVDRFNRRRDESDAQAAFAVLVARHGPMVMGVCRQLVQDHHLAEDAFQATFLVLARKARSLRDPDALASWLYGVALRTARSARLRASRRLRQEGTPLTSHPGADDQPDPAVPPADASLAAREEAEILMGEIERLPETFRLPVVFCYLEGLTVHEAADRLRWPHGTVRSRLARAREKLRIGLTRRGVVLPAAALAGLLDARPAPAAVPSALCDATARAAYGFAAGQAAAPAATALASEVLGSLAIPSLMKTTLATVIVLVVAGFAAGIGFLAMRPRAIGNEPGQASAVARPADDTPPPAPGRMTVVGRVLDLDGKPRPGATVMIHAALKQPGRGDAYDRMAPEPIGQARSDDSGRFRIDAPRTTSARHQHFGAVALAPGYGAGLVELDPDAERPVAEITLRPEQVIEGRLFDVKGQPVRGAQVAVQAMGVFVTAKQGTTAVDSFKGPSFWPLSRVDLPAWPRPAFSDADGRFTIRGVGRGLRVGLAVDDPRFARSIISVDADAGSRSKTVTAALEPARTIAGRVTDAETGRPIPHARLVVLSHQANIAYVNIFEADDQGRFRVNPRSADRYSINVAAPPGLPYLNASVPIFDWPKGATEHRVDLAMRTGVAVRGTVVEEGTNRPVARARISFASPVGDSASHGASGPDGTFQIAVPPGAGTLVVLGPSEDYVLRPIGDRSVREGKPGGRRFYAHAFVALEAKPDAESLTVAVPLRRGATVTGRVVGPDGRPIASAAAISRAIIPPQPGAWLRWRPETSGRVRDGRFELHGLDADAEVPVHFFEPKGRLGATVMLSGKSGQNGPITVRLEPCGIAQARLVGRDGTPADGDPWHRIALVVTPGLPAGSPPDGQLVADEAALARVDPLHYSDAPRSDAQGRITFPALIPGATYRITAGAHGGPATVSREFRVKPGETLDLGDLPADR